jgi:hypothetical protein
VAILEVGRFARPSFSQTLRDGPPPFFRVRIIRIIAEVLNKPGRGLKPDATDRAGSRNDERLTAFVSICDLCAHGPLGWEPAPSLGMVERHLLSNLFEGVGAGPN